MPANPKPNNKAASIKNSIKAIAEQLRDKKKVCILLGALAFHHPQAATLRYLAQTLAATLGATVSFMTDGANSAGAWLAGAVPHREAGGVVVRQAGLSANEMLANPREAYLLMNVEPDLDMANAALTIAALKQATFVAALSVYRNPILEAYAHVILPMAAFTETSGTFVNAIGTWQSFNGSAKAFHSSRPGWKILRVLANFLELDGFQYESSEEVKHELKQLVEKTPALYQQLSTQPKHFSLEAKSGLSRIGEIPIYAVDSLVRRAKPLQDAQTIMDGNVMLARIHPNTAKRFQLQDGALVNVKQQATVITLPIQFDTRIAEEALWIAGGTSVSGNLGELLGEIEVER